MTDAVESQDLPLIPISQPIVSCFLACAFVTRELFAYGRSGTAVNDWQITGLMREAGLLVDVPATQDHVDLGYADQIGDLVFEPSTEFLEVLGSFQKPVETTEETAEAAE